VVKTAVNVKQTNSVEKRTTHVTRTPLYVSIVVDFPTIILPTLTHRHDQVAIYKNWMSHSQ